jgi:hypothetical protein
MALLPPLPPVPPLELLPPPIAPLEAPPPWPAPPSTLVLPLDPPELVIGPPLAPATAALPPAAEEPAVAKPLPALGSTPLPAVPPKSRSSVLEQENSALIIPTRPIPAKQTLAARDFFKVHSGYH